MDFYEVVDQVANLLRQRGWLTYRSLKLPFKLDNETLEAVKDELLFAHPAADAEGRGIVGTGDAEHEPAAPLLTQSQDRALLYTRLNTWPRKSSSPVVHSKAHLQTPALGGGLQQSPVAQQGYDLSGPA